MSDTVDQTGEGNFGRLARACLFLNESPLWRRYGYDNLILRVELAQPRAER